MAEEGGACGFVWLEVSLLLRCTDELVCQLFLECCKRSRRTDGVFLIGAETMCHLACDFLGAFCCLMDGKRCLSHEVG